VVRVQRAVLRRDGGSFHYGKKIPLHSLPADVGAAAASSAGGHLVDLVDEDDSLFGRLFEGFADNRIHVDELLRFLGPQEAPGFGDLHSAALCLLRKQSAKHIADVDSHRVHTRAAEKRYADRLTLGDVDLDLAVVELPLFEQREQLSAGGFPHALFLGSRLGRLFALPSAAEDLHKVGHGGFLLRSRKQRVGETLLRPLRRRGLHLFYLAFLDHGHCGLGEISDDGLDVAAHIPHFGKLCRLHLDERRFHQLRKPAGYLGLADAGRPHHKDILRRHFFRHLGREISPPDTVSQRNGDRLLCLLLAHDVPVEILDDPARRELHFFNGAVHSPIASTVTMLSV